MQEKTYTITTHLQLMGRGVKLISRNDRADSITFQVTETALNKIARKFPRRYYEIIE